MNKKSFLKVLLLIGVYSLHLVFIQILMDADSASVAQSFKSFFSHSQTHQTPHQPVTQYYQQHKHVNKQSRAEVTSPAYSAYNGNQLFTLIHKYTGLPLVISPRFSSISDDAYRRYRLHCTFLI